MQSFCHGLSCLEHLESWRLPTTRISFTTNRTTFMPNLSPLDDSIKTELDNHLRDIEDKLGADVMAIVSPILPGLEVRVRHVVESRATKRPALAIILDTPGGVVEVVERMVITVRHHYPTEVIFVVPNRAMSAGTVFVMCGDRILMDYFSCLGPIDPQIEKDGRLVPALSYLSQYERLKTRAAGGNLTAAEYALLTKLDLGELHQFEQARDLSRDLLVRWLTSYKFKNWQTTETTQTLVTPTMREERARQIADRLSDNERWHSHGRGISMETLESDDIKLKIEDYSRLPCAQGIRDYFDLLTDYMARGKLSTFVHSTDYF
jgi:hypothetical protein